MFRPRLADDADVPGSAPPGSVVEMDSNDASDGLRVACGRGSVWIREVQPAGKRRMTAAAWLRGRGLAQGARLA
jgi:methionyl-tRNA formyltransferase